MHCIQRGYGPPYEFNLWRKRDGTLIALDADGNDIIDIVNEGDRLRDKLYERLRMRHVPYWPESRPYSPDAPVL